VLFAGAICRAQEPEAPPPPLNPPEPPIVKHMEIDKSQQVLRAYEGDRVVLETRVSTGRLGRETPNGTFRVEEKHRMHYSKRYHHAPMPFSLQVNGNYFIHGFTAVPDKPASHGCIRVPLSADNPAKKLYEWAELGTPVTISGQWQDQSEKAATSATVAAERPSRPRKAPAPIRRSKPQKPTVGETVRGFFHKLFQR
jgi:hypothetical protein